MAHSLLYSPLSLFLIGSNIDGYKWLIHELIWGAKKFGTAFLESFVVERVATCSEKVCVKAIAEDKGFQILLIGKALAGVTNI